MSHGRRTGVLWLALFLLAGCRPLYLPPIPESPPARPLTALGDESALSITGDSLTLHLVLSQVAAEGWLALQWFAPAGAEVASDSVWITPGDVGTGRTFVLPPDVPMRAGEWRAVVSFEGVVLRQFRTAVVEVATVPVAARTEPSASATAAGADRRAIRSYVAADRRAIRSYVAAVAWRTPVGGS